MMRHNAFSDIGLSFCGSVIEEANWLTLEDDVRHMVDVVTGTRFDAVVCLGNSLSALPDFEGGQSKHRRALSNFWALVRPGGLLLVDHRNYDGILETGVFPSSNIYYDVSCARPPTFITKIARQGPEFQKKLLNP